MAAETNTVYGGLSTKFRLPLQIMQRKRRRKLINPLEVEKLDFLDIVTHESSRNENAPLKLPRMRPPTTDTTTSAGDILIENTYMRWLHELGVDSDTARFMGASRVIAQSPNVKCFPSLDQVPVAADNISGQTFPPICRFFESLTSEHSTGQRDDEKRRLISGTVKQFRYLLKSGSLSWCDDFNLSYSHERPSEPFRIPPTAICDVVRKFKRILSPHSIILSSCERIQEELNGRNNLFENAAKRIKELPQIEPQEQTVDSQLTLKVIPCMFIYIALKHLKHPI